MDRDNQPPIATLCRSPCRNKASGLGQDDPLGFLEFAQQAHIDELGLDIGKYKGRTVHMHDGSWVGFRAHYARFPEDNFSVVALCNRSDARDGERIKNRWIFQYLNFLNDSFWPKADLDFSSFIGARTTAFGKSGH